MATHTATGLSPTEAFLLGWLPRLLQAHHETLGVVTPDLAARGHELIGAIWDVESLVVRGLGTRPPPPPLDPAACEAWIAALDALGRTLSPLPPADPLGAAVAPSDAHALGVAFGGLQRIALVGARLQRLLAATPADPGLLAVAAALPERRAGALAQAALARPIAERSPTLRQGLIDAQGALAKAAAPGDADAPARAVGQVGRASHAVERALAFEPQAAIAAWRAKRTDGLALRRGFALHPSWSLPVYMGQHGLAARVFQFDKRVLMGFSDPAMQARAPSILKPDERLFATLGGGSLLALLDGSQVDVFVVDPTDDPDFAGTINYQADQLAALRTAAAEARVSDALCGWLGLDRDVIRAHRFFIAGTQHIMVPNALGRMRVALFTTEAALEAARRREPAGSPLAMAQVMTLPGSVLLPSVAAVDCAGAVVDPYGPGPSRTLERRVVARLADG